MDLRRQELADAIGITPSQVTSLAGRGVFKSVRKGFYNLADSVQAYIDDQTEQLVKQHTPKQTVAQEETLNYWKMIRQKNAALREMGVTMKTEDAESLMSIRLEQIRNVLNTIDSVWAPYMVGLKTTEDSQKMLSKQLDTLFEQLSNLQDFILEDEESTIDDDEDDDTTT